MIFERAERAIRATSEAVASRGREKLIFVGMTMERIKLTHICNPKQWKTIPASDLLDGGYPVYGANGIIGFYNEYNHEEPVVTITCRGATCGTVNITVPKSYVTGNAMCLDDVRTDIDLRYLYYCLLHYDFRNVISGSAQPQITRQGLEKVVLSIGTRDEQRRIISILDKVNAVIDTRKKELQKLDDLIKARFVEMFGDGKYPIAKTSAVCDFITKGTFNNSIEPTLIITSTYSSYNNKSSFIFWINKSLYIPR